LYAEALAATEAGQGRKELLDDVGSKYLDHLILERKYTEAATLCPKLLRGSASAWERRVFHFAQLRQLHVLVPYMPIESPRLTDTAYEVALVALTTHHSFHKELLLAIKSWPQAIYSVLPIISAIEPQLNTSSSSETLKEALAELYVMNNQYEKAVALYSDLMKPGIFEFIDNHNLHNSIRDKVVQLMMLDCKRTVSMFIQHKDIIHPTQVVEQLLHSDKKCDKKYFLHLYLHSLYEIDLNAGWEFHDLQVELYADYDQRLLLPFLRTSQHYKLDKAYEICLRKDLLKEQVFILGRMGNSRKALAVIINNLEDIEQAMEFVSLQQDDELWEELIKLCLLKPEMVGVLLEHTVGNLDPLYIVRLVPNGLQIPRLRDRLVRIITDYRTETSLRHGCNDILKADCVNLLVKYFKEAKHGIYLGSIEEETNTKEKIRNTNDYQMIETDRPQRTMELKSKTRGGGRCCLCLDSFSIQNVSVIVFFCCHSYHVSCLISSSDSANSGSNDGESYDNDDDKDDIQSDKPRLRCVLCTTAVG